jgi:hypothetical protein
MGFSPAVITSPKQIIVTTPAIGDNPQTAIALKIFIGGTSSFLGISGVIACAG